VLSALTAMHRALEKNGKKLLVKLIDAYIYHYGWVKTPEQMKQKIKEVSKYWIADDTALQTLVNSEDYFNFNEFDSLEKIFQAHTPAVMQPRIQNFKWKNTFRPFAKKIFFKR